MKTLQMQQGEVIGGEDLQIDVLWDRTQQRFPTSFMSRRDYYVYHHIEEQLEKFHHLRIYEE